MQTTETAMASKRVWENEEAPFYLDAAIVNPDGIAVAAITDRGKLNIFDIVGKDRVCS